MHLLLASSNSIRRQQLELAFAVMGTIVDSFTSLETALTRLERKQSIYDVILLDADQALEEATKCCTTLREQQCTSNIVILSSSLAANEVSQLLFSFADDVIRLPAAPEEVVARLYARARRCEQLQTTRYTWGDFTVDTLAMTIFFHQERLPLSKKEFYIFSLLIEMSPHTVTRSHIASRLWDTPDAVAANTIDAHIKNIRHKLAACSSVQIETIRGVGYCCHELSHTPTRTSR